MASQKIPTSLLAFEFNKKGLKLTTTSCSKLYLLKNGLDTYMRFYIKIVFAILIILSSYLFWPFDKRTFGIKKPSPVKISDNGLLFQLSTDSQTVAEILAEKNIEFSEKDYIFPALDAKICPGQKITIRRAVPVTIEVDEQKIKLDTLGTTVRDAIIEADVTLSHADKISPSLNSLLEHNLDIVVTRINFEEITIKEDIPFKTIEKEDSTVPWKQKQIKQKGKNGKKELTYKITYTNGKETSRKLISQRVVKQPVAEIKVIGTKIVVGKTSRGTATWYSNGNGLTCASLKFPLGTYLRVTNLSNKKSVIVKVNDRGPFSKEKIIDLNKKAFEKIAGLGDGVISVKIEEILN